jgi:hypothetical protein
LAWHGLPAEQKIRATVKMIGGPVYTAHQSTDCTTVRSLRIRRVAPKPANENAAPVALPDAGRGSRVACGRALGVRLPRDRRSRRGRPAPLLQGRTVFGKPPLREPACCRGAASRASTAPQKSASPVRSMRKSGSGSSSRKRRVIRRRRVLASS